MKLAIALALFIVTAPAVHADTFSPRCNGLGLRTGMSITVTPSVLYRTPDTTAEVWFHNPIGTARSQEGWTRIAVSAKEGDSQTWHTYYGMPGRHALALQVVSNGKVVDGWLTNPDCLRYFEIADLEF